MAWRCPFASVRPLAQHHVAAAFAMDRPGLRKTRQPGAKPGRRRERAGMELRIAAGQPAGIAVARRRLVGKRREGDDLGAGAPPAVENVRIDEAEGLIERERDALAGRRQRWHRPARCSACRSGQQRRRRHHAVEIDMALRQCGQPIEPAGEVAVLAGLHQAEMPLGQRERRVARDRAENRNCSWARSAAIASLTSARCRSLPTRLRMTPAMRTAGSWAAKPRSTAARRLRLPGHVEHQQHRQAEACRQIGGGAAAARRSGDAVEQPHDAFDHDELGVAGGLRQQGVRAAAAASPSCRD